MIAGLQDPSTVVVPETERIQHSPPMGGYYFQSKMFLLLFGGMCDLSTEGKSSSPHPRFTGLPYSIRATEPDVFGTKVVFLFSPQPQERPWMVLFDFF